MSGTSGPCRILSSFALVQACQRLFESKAFDLKKPHAVALPNSLNINAKQTNGTAISACIVISGRSWSKCSDIHEGFVFICKAPPYPTTYGKQEIM